MRIPLFKRLVLSILNILFPPLAVLLLCGLNEDVLFSCLLFLLGVIPAHIHSFYISFTYFSRKRKVRKGVYPGQPRPLIWSEKVNNGGASNQEVERLRRQDMEGRVSRRTTRRLTGGGGGGSRSRIEHWDDEYKQHGTGLQMDRISAGRNRRSHRRGRYSDEYLVEC